MTDLVAAPSLLGVPYTPPTVPVAPPGDVPPNVSVPAGGAWAVSETPLQLGGGPAIIGALPPADDASSAPSSSGTSPGAIEQVVRAHESLARVAARIAAEIRPIASDTPVLVQDGDGAGLVAAFRAFRAQAQLLALAFEAIAPPAPAPSPNPPAPASPISTTASGNESAAANANYTNERLVIAPLAASAVAAIKAADSIVLPVKHIAGLFQSHVSGLEARLVHPDEAALVAEIARHLRDAGRAVLYPRLVPMELRDPMPALLAIAAALDEAERAERAARARVAALDVPSRTEANAELTPLAAALAGMRKQMFELPDSSPVPSDARALIEGADRVRELDAGAVLLVVQIAGAGSTPRAATAWHWKPAYTAGAVVSYFLASGSAELLRSGTVRDYSSFREPASS